MEIYARVVLFLIIFVFGACIGSFLNVCIYRLPRGRSLVYPSQSYCPICHEPIAWYDNVPLFSYIALGRCCRKCGSLISPRYFMVELLTGTMFVLFFWALQSRGETPAVVTVYILLLCALIVGSFIDLELRIIPDEITIGGMLLVPIVCLLIPDLHNMPEFGRAPVFFENNMRLGSLAAGLLGMAVGSFAIYASGVFGKVLFRKEAMGFGDVKLMAVIGGVLGWRMALLVFFVAPVIGLGIGIAVLVKKRDHHIPYGPFLSIATIVVILAGHKILYALNLEMFLPV